MLLENLYRVFLHGQQVALQDARTSKILWRGLSNDIPLEYLNYNVVVVMSCALTQVKSEILILIA